LFFANPHKIPQNFDLKTSQKVQNRKNRMKNSFHRAFIPFI
jgi:hypothetical protein